MRTKIILDFIVGGALLAVSIGCTAHGIAVDDRTRTVNAPYDQPLPSVRPDQKLNLTGIPFSDANVAECRGMGGIPVSDVHHVATFTCENVRHP